MIIALPVVGMIAYLFLGETNIGRRRRRRIREVLGRYAKVLRMRLARMRPPYRPKSRSVMSICSALDTR